MTRKKRLYLVGDILGVLFTLLIFIIPFYFMFVQSIKSKKEANRLSIAWPTELHFENYLEVIRHGNYQLVTSRPADVFVNGTGVEGSKVETEGSTNYVYPFTVEAGDYVLRADKQNCLPLELEVTVEEDRRLALEFRLYGDANRDGRVDISDVTAVQRYIAEFDVDIDVEAAEVVPDGKLNVKDVTEIQRFLAEFIPSLKPTV